MQQIADSIDVMRNGCLIIQESNGETLLTFNNNENLLSKIESVHNLLLWIIMRRVIVVQYFKVLPCLCFTLLHKHQIWTIIWSSLLLLWKIRKINYCLYLCSLSSWGLSAVSLSLFYCPGQTISRIRPWNTACRKWISTTKSLCG